MPWIRKSLVFRTDSKFCEQEIYKNDPIVDIYVNIEVLTTDIKMIQLRNP